MIYEAAIATGRRARRLLWLLVVASDGTEATTKVRGRIGEDTAARRLYAGPFPCQCKFDHCKTHATVLRNGWWPNCDEHARTPAGHWNYIKRIPPTIVE